MLVVLRHVALHYSAPLATHDTPALRRCHSAGRRCPISRNVTSVRSDAPRSGCTNPGYSQVLAHRAAPGAGLATSCECCSGSIARSPELLARLGEAVRLAAPVFPRGS